MSFCDLHDVISGGQELISAHGVSSVDQRKHRIYYTLDTVLCCDSALSGPAPRGAVTRVYKNVKKRCKRNNKGLLTTLGSPPPRKRGRWRRSSVWLACQRGHRLEQTRS